MTHVCQVTNQFHLLCFVPTRAEAPRRQELSVLFTAESLMPRTVPSSDLHTQDDLIYSFFCTLTLRTTELDQKGSFCADI